jgi:tRNA dimethylallyltransferase
MKNNGLPKIMIILGPTASGKSDLAVKIALEHDGEVISADSRQVYKGLDIGSGKISIEEMKGVPHHLLNVVSPNKTFTASDYAKYARKSIKSIISRKKLPIICGGTGFYIDALVYNNSIAPIPPDKKIRKKLEKLSLKELSDKLSNLDPDRFASIDTQNRVRLIRAIEIVLSTGKPVPRLEKNPLYETEKIGIMWPVKKLDERIEERLDSRLKNGMMEEVMNLKFPDKGKGLSWKRLYYLGLEYRYISLFLKGELDYDAMRRILLTAIKQYSRRQMTWFKRDKEIKWIKKS